MTVCNCMYGIGDPRCCAHRNVGWALREMAKTTAEGPPLHRRWSAEEKIGSLERLIGEADGRIVELRRALENLAGDVYLYGLGEIRMDQLLGTQGEALRLLQDGDADPGGAVTPADNPSRRTKGADTPKAGSA